MNFNLPNMLTNIASIKIQKLMDKRISYLQNLQCSSAISSLEGMKASRVTISPLIYAYATLIGLDLEVKPIQKKIGYLSNLSRYERRFGSKNESSISEKDLIPAAWIRRALIWLWLNFSFIYTNLNPEDFPPGVIPIWCRYNCKL